MVVLLWGHSAMYSPQQIVFRADYTTFNGFLHHPRSGLLKDGQEGSQSVLQLIPCSVLSCEYLVGYFCDY